METFFPCLAQTTSIVLSGDKNRLFFVYVESKRLLASQQRTILYDNKLNMQTFLFQNGKQFKVT